jgi:hypothetical protein
MRHETRRKLEHAVRMRRLKMTVIGVAAALGLGATFLLVDLDAHETKLKLAGTIEEVHTFAGKGALDGLEVGVKLEDGRHVKVLAHKSRSPHVGDQIEVTEHRHLTGRTTFTLR